MKYWIHRISHLQQLSRPLLDKGYLSMGFSNCSYEDFLVEVAENQNRGYFDEEFNEVLGWRPRSRFALWRFLAEMRAGDWVVVPGKKTFSVYQLCDDLPNLPADDGLDLPDTDWNGRKVAKGERLLEIEGREMDIGFLRKVAVVAKDIPRDGFADAKLTSRMKTQVTTADICDLAESLNRAVEAFRKNTPLNLKAALVEQSVDSWKETILNELNPDKFERLVKWYFQRLGATEVSIPPKNQRDKSGDVDVTAVFEAIRTIISVQVKFHQGETSDWAIQQVRDFAQSKENLSDGYIRQYWVVSSADRFTEEACKLAQENNILLIGGGEFVEMLLNVGIGGLEF